MRYQFLKEHRDEVGSIRKACETLKVSKSGYYEYLGRRKTNKQIEQEALERIVAEAFERQQGRYGYRRINQELRKIGVVVSEKRVLKVMNKLGLQAKGIAPKQRRAKVLEMKDLQDENVSKVYDFESDNQLHIGDIVLVSAG